MIVGFHYRRTLTRRGSRGATPEGRPRPAARATDAGAWRAPPVGATELPAAAEDTETAPASGSAAAAMIARQRLVAAGHLEPGTGKPLLVEQLRPIAGALRARAFAPNAGRCDRLILVSSADRGEAASFVAVKLALALSQDDGQAVLLVDAAPQAMGSAGAFGLPPAPGLCDALEHGGALDEFVMPTGLDDLSLMPPGSARPRMAELSASRRMARLVRELLEGAPQRLVLIDAPPLPVGTTGAALAMFAGQVVLVAVAGRTSEQAIEHSLRRLDGRENVSFVLSRTSPPAARSNHAARCPRP